MPGLTAALDSAGRVCSVRLADAGEEPSIIRIQALIGGGSFSTVKKHLDAWKVQRQAAVAPVAVPEAVTRRVEEFGRQLWQEAAALAAGFAPVTLGPRVLRAETAPLAVLALCA